MSIVATVAHLSYCNAAGNKLEPWQENTLKTYK